MTQDVTQDVSDAVRRGLLPDDMWLQGIDEALYLPVEDAVDGVWVRVRWDVQSRHAGVR